MKRRSETEIATALAEAKKMVSKGTPVSEACKQLGISASSWYRLSRKTGPRTPKRKYRRSPRPTLLPVPAPVSSEVIYVPGPRLIALMGSVPEVLSALRGLA